MTHLLVDGDILAYKASSSVQKDIDWGDGLYTCHAYLDDAIEQFKNLLDDILYALKETTLEEYNTSDMIFFFSDKENFRKIYYPDYKSSRKNNRKPTCYKALVEWVYNNYQAVKPTRYFEADDMIGIYATEHDNSIIVSMDKDFKTIPSKFFDFGRGIFKDITKDEADYWLMYQTLVGDATDGYKGCPTYGDVKARKLLDNTPVGSYWEAVVNAFIKQGCTEQDAILQYNLARILRSDDLARWRASKGNIPPMYNLSK